MGDGDAAGRRPIIIGNWKMNGGVCDLAVLDAVIAGAATTGPEAAICPPFPLIGRFAERAGDRLAIGGQDCHAAPSGAHTGDVSAEMLADSGAGLVILGHSERRAAYGETDAQVRAKAEAAWRAGLTAVICVGETLEQRDRGEAAEVVRAQIAASTPDGADAARLILAYEPVWAIGTGRTPSLEDIGDIHYAARGALEARAGAAVASTVRLLYGGSVKPSNAAEILAVDHVDGALVGGASLKAEDFLAILAAAPT